MSDASQDPLEFLKSMWGGMGFPLPGMVTPTLDLGELDKRITDLKTVENWLKMNLGMLQMSIQGLEMQRTTIAAMQTMNSTAGGEAGAVPGSTNPGLWPWSFMQQTADAAAAVPPSDDKK